MKLLKLLSEAAHSLTTNQFPLLTSTLTDRNRGHLNTYLELINNAMNVGEIVNPAYQSAKSFINGVLNTAFEKLISDKYFHDGKWKNLPPEMHQSLGYSYPQIHTIGSIKKKLNKFEHNHPLIKDLNAFLDEIQPLINNMLALKEKIVKKPRAVVDKEAEEKAYQIKIASHDDVRQIREKLTEITREVYDAALAANLKWLLAVAATVKTKLENTNESTYKLFMYDPFSMSVARLITVPGSNGWKEKVVDDYNPILEKEANRMTREMMDRFISKNTTKLSEITAKKNNLNTVELLSANTSRGVVEGIMKLIFNDASEFTVHNKVVLSYSKYNKPFYRFPTTFHNVILSDGSKMSKPSEESMIAQFV